MQVLIYKEIERTDKAALFLLKEQMCGKTFVYKRKELWVPKSILKEQTEDYIIVPDWIKL